MGPGLRSGGSGRLWWLSWEILALAKSASAPGPNFSPAPFAEALLGRSTKDSRPFVMWRPAGMFISKVYCSVPTQSFPSGPFLRYSRRLMSASITSRSFPPLQRSIEDVRSYPFPYSAMWQFIKPVDLNPHLQSTTPTPSPTHPRRTLMGNPNLVPANKDPEH